MPRFAANLSMMFTEVPFIERFAAARKAGFDAVEFLFPYDYSTLQIQKQLEQNHLTLALFNTAPGDINAGEWGLSALPGREHEAHADIDLALEYALALNCEQVHVMAGVVPAGEDAERYRAVFIDNLRYAADRFAPHGNQMYQSRSAIYIHHLHLLHLSEAMNISFLQSTSYIYIVKIHCKRCYIIDNINSILIK